MHYGIATVDMFIYIYDIRQTWSIQLYGNWNLITNLQNQESIPYNMTKATSIIPRHDAEILNIHIILS